MSDRVLIGSLCEVAGFAAVLFAVGATAKSYASLPEQVAIHFNMRGEPNGWGPRGVVLVFPAVALVMFGVLTVINPVVGLDTIVLGPGAARDPIATLLIFAFVTVLMAAASRGVIAFNLGQTPRMASPAFVLVATFAALALALALYFDAIAVP